MCKLHQKIEIMNNFGVFPYILRFGVEIFSLGLLKVFGKLLDGKQEQSNLYNFIDFLLLTNINKSY